MLALATYWIWICMDWVFVKPIGQRTLLSQLGFVQPYSLYLWCTCIESNMYHQCTSFRPFTLYMFNAWPKKGHCSHDIWDLWWFLFNIFYWRTIFFQCCQLQLSHVHTFIHIFKCKDQFWWPFKINLEVFSGLEPVQGLLFFSPILLHTCIYFIYSTLPLKFFCCFFFPTLYLCRKDIKAKRGMLYIEMNFFIYFNSLVKIVAN